MEQGGRKAAARAISDAVLQKVCPIAGTPSQCIERLVEYRASGCTHIMLELWGDDRLEQARLFGEKCCRTSKEIIGAKVKLMPRALRAL